MTKVTPQVPALAGMTPMGFTHITPQETPAMTTLRDFQIQQDRLEYAMYAPEVGMLQKGAFPVFYAYIGGEYVQRHSREELAGLLVRAWDKGVKTGA